MADLLQFAIEDLTVVTTKEDYLNGRSPQSIKLFGAELSACVRRISLGEECHALLVSERSREHEIPESPSILKATLYLENGSVLTYETGDRIRLKQLQMD